MRSADYYIVIEGELDAALASEFQPHDVRRDAGTTTIIGVQLDQAALIGILSTATELALTIVQVERVPHETRPNSSNLERT